MLSVHDRKLTILLWLRWAAFRIEKNRRYRDARDAPASSSGEIGSRVDLHSERRVRDDSGLVSLLGSSSPQELPTLRHECGPRRRGRRGRCRRGCSCRSLFTIFLSFLFVIFFFHFHKYHYSNNNNYRQNNFSSISLPLWLLLLTLIIIIIFFIKSYHF